MKKYLNKYFRIFFFIISINHLTRENQNSNLYLFNNFFYFDIQHNNYQENYTTNKL